MKGNRPTVFGQLAQKFAHYESESQLILHHLGRTKPLTPDKRLASMLSVCKQAVAAVVVSPHDIYKYRHNPERISIGMQVRKDVIRDANTTGNTWENPGGAFLTDQELAVIQATGMSPEEAPGHLFYDVWYEQLMAGNTHPEFTYKNTALRTASVAGKIRKYLRTELQQEMGVGASQLVRLTRQTSSEGRVTDLLTVNFDTDEKERNRDIVEKYGEQFGVTLEQAPNKKGTQVRGIVTRVHEHAMIADVDSVWDVAMKTVPTEEANRMYVHDLGEVMDLFRKATKGSTIEERADSWDHFERNYSHLRRPRAPSTAWQIRMLLEYVDHQMRQGKMEAALHKHS